MNLKKITADILRDYGEAVTLTRGEVSARELGVVLPIRSKSRQYDQPQAVYGGMVDRGFAQLYLAGERWLLREGDVVDSSAGRYVVVRAEQERLRGEIIYQWAAMTAAPEDEEEAA